MSEAGRWLYANFFFLASVTGEGGISEKGVCASVFGKRLTLSTAQPIPIPVLTSAEGATKNAAPDATLANSDPPSAAPMLPWQDERLPSARSRYTPMGFLCSAHNDGILGIPQYPEKHILEHVPRRLEDRPCLETRGHGGGARGGSVREVGDVVLEGLIA